MNRILLSLTIVVFLFACSSEGGSFPSTDKQDSTINDTIHVTGVSFDKTSMTIKEGSSETIIATVNPSNADDKSLTWTSSDNLVATVIDGLVNGIKEGEVIITATSNDQKMEAICSVSVAPLINTIAFEQNYFTIAGGQQHKVAVTIIPDNAFDKSLSWSSSDSTVAVVNDNGIVTGISRGNATITAEANDGSGAFGSCTVRINISFVDLGLSVNWADCNLGATKPEFSGSFFSWGETAPKSSSYKWGTITPVSGGPTYNLTKYNEEDNKSTLDLSDDAAYVIIGERYRVPTVDEWKELMNGCTWKWDDAKCGYQVVSKKTGYSDKSIFLPAAGCNRNMGEGGSTDFYNEIGLYWSSSLVTNGPNSIYDAIALYFETNITLNLRNTYRNWGLSIRPVIDK